jgi:hypothetical protein
MGRDVGEDAIGPVLSEPGWAVPTRDQRTSIHQYRQPAPHRVWTPDIEGSFRASGAAESDADTVLVLGGIPIECEASEVTCQQ